MTGNNQESIGDTARKIDIAMRFTDGDMDRAKLMVSGKLQDVMAIKGKFVSPDQNRSGIFLACFNVMEDYISTILVTAVSNTSIFPRVRIFDDWKSLYKNIVAFGKGEDSIDSHLLRDSMLDIFIRDDLFQEVQKQDLDYLSVKVQDILKEILGAQTVNSQIDMEKTSSLELAVAGLEIMLPFSDNEQTESNTREESQEGEHEEKTDFDRRLAEVESQANYVVEGLFILSPVRGKSIKDIEEGERVFVVLPAQDMITQKILEVYNARNSEGKPKPIIGKVVEKVPNEDGKGYIIYVLIAKGIYAKIVEEENVKIQTELSMAAVNAENSMVRPAYTRYFNIFIYLLFALLVGALIFILSSI